VLTEAATVKTIEEQVAAMLQPENALDCGATVSSQQHNNNNNNNNMMNARPTQETTSNTQPH
jgi:hypothetical protein